MIKNKKILITGGAGFIGYYLLKKLAPFNQITLIDNLNRGKKDKFLRECIKLKSVNFINLDLTNKNNYKKQDYDFVFLLASIVGVKNVNDNPYDTLKVNIQSTFNTIDLVKFKKETKLIYFSTSEIYSPLVIKKKKFFPIKEDVDLLFLKDDNPRYTYYISKIIGEKLIKFSDQPFLIFRPHNIYGPRMGFSHVIPEQIKKIKNQLNSKVFSPHHKRAFCYIDDAIDQMLFLCQSKNNYNKIFNIGNPKEPINMLKLSKLIKKIIRSKVKLIPSSVTSGSITKRVPFIKKKLHDKCKTSLEEGLKKTIDWYCNNENI